LLLTHTLSFLTSTFVTGVALGDIHLRFTWQGWHLVTSTFVSRGRCGTVALTALGGLWWPTGFSADAVDAAALCVAGVALGHIHIRFTWQAWHLRHWAGSQLTPWTPRLFAWQAWHLVTSTFTLRGRRGTWRHPPLFTWQAWHLVTFTFVSRGRRGTYGTGRALVAHQVLSCRRARRGSLRGRSGTW